MTLQLLEQHRKLLVAEDPNFREYWSGLSRRERENRWELAIAVQQVTKLAAERLGERHYRETERARRYFSCIPQKDLDYGRRPGDWGGFVGDDRAKKALFLAASEALRGFLGERLSRKDARLYGNVKPQGSLNSGIGKRKRGTAARRRLRDTWDAVRYRMVAKDLATLREIGIELWQAYLDEIVRCRNYYLQPKGDSASDPYRALHFEIEIFPQRWIELQALTEARDLVGYLDYAVTFKKTVTLPSVRHKSWLSDFSLKANLFDCRGIPGRQILA